MEANKVDYKGIIIRVFLFIAMLFCGYVSMLSAYNLLASYDFGMDVSSMYSAMRWVMPLVSATLYYFLYRMYVGLLRTTLNSRMGVFSKLIDVLSLREIVDPRMAILALYVGLVNLLFLFYPVYRNILPTLLKEIGVGLFAYLTFKRLGKNLDKVYNPIMFWGMQLPLVILVVLV